MGPDIAPGLAEALEARDVGVVKAWRQAKRSYLIANGFFGRASSDPADVAVLEHEVAVRELVGTEGALRSPAVLEHGPGWMLEQCIEHEPLVGDVAVDAITAAAADLADLRLPRAPSAREGSRMALKRRIRALFSPLPLSDYLAARRVLGDPGLPTVTSHGDFHSKNVLVAGAQPWVVDWELSGVRPAGYDLMTFWPTLDRTHDRERLFEATVDVVGRRRELLRLRYALAVRAVASMLANARTFDREEARARELMSVLPSLRAEAGFGSGGRR